MFLLNGDVFIESAFKDHAAHLDHMASGEAQLSSSYYLCKAGNYWKGIFNPALSFSRSVNRSKSTNAKTTNLSMLHVHCA